MDENGSLQVPKKQMPVTLWVHPEGQVLGAIFLHLPHPDQAAGEQPWDVLNEAADFIVVKRDSPEELCFYNKRSIVRVEFWGGGDESAGGRPLACRINLMDGSVLDGQIVKALPQGRSRLYDYMNDPAERFLKLCLPGGGVVLLNKNYVVSILPLQPEALAAQPGEAGPGQSGSLELAA